MIKDIRFAENFTDEAGVCEHLFSCEGSFNPPLSSRVDISGYAKKIYEQSHRFEALSGLQLVGLIALYINIESKSSFITNVSVLPGWQGQGISTSLLGLCLSALDAKGVARVSLEVSAGSHALNLYRKHGFTVERVQGDSYFMVRS